MLRRLSISTLLTGLPVVCLSACLSHDSLDIPPGPVVAPPGVDIYVYVAEGTDEEFENFGGAVSVYQLGSDAEFLEGPPSASIPTVNPRRLGKHPELDVLYVLGLNQVQAFDISGGGLRSLCANPADTLAPPCATSPRPGANPVDLVVRQSEDGSAFVLYVTDGGFITDPNAGTRISAYPLDANGGLPAVAGSIARNDTSQFFRGLAVTERFAYAGDATLNAITRFDVAPDGSLPIKVPAQSPGPTPEPTPSPTPSPEGSPTPTPVLWYVPGPQRMEIIFVPGGDGVPRRVLYVATNAIQRVSSYPVDADGNLEEVSSTSYEIDGFFQDLLIAPDGQRIYATAFQQGQVDTYAIGEDGEIVLDSFVATADNPQGYPNGLDWLSFTDESGEVQNRVFVSQGGFDRIDSYEVLDDGSLAQYPISSSEEKPFSFPTDVQVFVDD